ncbi:MAG: tRNA preQ1(34) S-adenosylmethionine ribosyltransferase-isomerase QueA [Dehalococcoidales bacterium]
MKTSDFDYDLPSEFIAQTPVEPRDSSRLLVLNRTDGAIVHRKFYEITDFLKSGDVLVMNNSRVIPARLFGRKVDTGTAVEILLLRRAALSATWEVLVKPGKWLPVGSIVELNSTDGKIQVNAEIKAVLPDGVREVSFSDELLLPELGQIPLPPYIHTPLADPERYQTVYARDAGSAAAPTAGLHFTPRLLDELNDKGVECLFTTLHIGLDTFRPVQVEDPAQHHIHREYGFVTPEVASRISKAKAEGRRVVCVGTTSVRLLEYAAQKSANAALDPFEGWVDLLILPGYRFRLVDTMLTNFHLPRSTLMMLVSAFAGAELIKKAYAEAIKEKYRFYSFGDVMLIL